MIKTFYQFKAYTLYVKIFITLIFISCSGKNNADIKKVKSKTAKTPFAYRLFLPNFPIKTKSFHLVVQPPRVIDKKSLLKVNFTLKNISKNELSFDLSKSHLNIYDAKNYIKNPDLNILKFTLKPGEVKEENLIFDVISLVIPIDLYFYFEKNNPKKLVVIRFNFFD